MCIAYYHHANFSCYLIGREIINYQALWRLNPVHWAILDHYFILEVVKLQSYLFRETVHHFPCVSDSVESYIYIFRLLVFDMPELESRGSVVRTGNLILYKTELVLDWLRFSSDWTFLYPVNPKFFVLRLC